MTELLPHTRLYRGAERVPALAKQDDRWPLTGFDPASLPGLTVWLDASQLGLADGAAVSPWPDLSGGGHHGAIVGMPAPVLRAGALNGLPVVRFKPNEGRVRGAHGFTGPLGNFNCTLVYLARMVGPNVGRIFAGSYPTVNMLVGFHTSAYECMYDNAWVNAGKGWPAVPTPWKLYGCDMSHDGANYLARFLIDGVVSGTNTAGTGMAGGWNLSGYSATGTEETCDGEVAELLLYDRKLPDTDRQAVEAYLRDKWLPVLA